MGLTITNNGTTSFDVLEYIEKTTTLEPGVSLTLDADTKKFKIGDIEIEIT